MCDHNSRRQRSENAVKDKTCGSLVGMHSLRRRNNLLHLDSGPGLGTEFVT